MRMHRYVRRWVMKYAAHVVDKALIYLYLYRTFLLSLYEIHTSGRGGIHKVMLTLTLCYVSLSRVSKAALGAAADQGLRSIQRSTADATGILMSGGPTEVKELAGY